MDIVNSIVPDYATLARPVKRAKGHISFDDKYVADTMRCTHCGAQWIYIKGSGRSRGYCRSCRDVTCGKAECIPCIPAEVRLDAMEKHKSLVQVMKERNSEPVVFLSNKV